MDSAAYISLDVLDLGVDLLLEYESLLQDEELDKAKNNQEKIQIFNKLSLEAGDQTTKKLRDFRDNVAEVCDKFGLKKDLIVAEVGGDELTLVVNSKDISEEKLQELLFALKQKTNTRVIKTVVGETDKNVSPGSSEEDKVKEHLKAIKRAETGAGIAKDIEEAVRKLNLILQTHGEEAVAKKIGSLSKLFVIETWEKKPEVKSSVIVSEKEGEFKISKLGYQFDYKSIQSDLDGILGRKTPAQSAEEEKVKKQNVA